MLTSNNYLKIYYKIFSLSRREKTLWPDRHIDFQLVFNIIYLRIK